MITCGDAKLLGALLVVRERHGGNRVQLVQCKGLAVH